MPNWPEWVADDAVHANESQGITVKKAGIFARLPSIPAHVSYTTAREFRVGSNFPCRKSTEFFEPSREYELVHAGILALEQRISARVVRPSLHVLRTAAEAMIPSRCLGKADRLNKLLSLKSETW